MQAEIDSLLNQAKAGMDKALARLSDELNNVRTGKASPQMVNGVMVDYYGTMTPISQVANVGTADARTITIQPWEKSLIPAIEKSIFEANLGLTPQNDGEMVRLIVPPLTEDRRKDMVKRTKALGEDAKVAIRNFRQKAMDGIKKSVKNGYPEDAGKKMEHNAQEMTNAFGKRVDEILGAKEKEIMKV